MRANEDVDRLFIESVQRLIASRGTPILLAIAGPTAAGKTEIVERLRADDFRQGNIILDVTISVGAAIDSGDSAFN